MPTQIDTTHETAPSVSDVFDILNADGAGSVVLICEHASTRIPARYGTLGLSLEARSGHIAWDPGAREVALRLMGILDAPLVASRISRLIYDCNRPPERSERFDVPGNRDLSETQRHDRQRCVYDPFRARGEEKTCPTS
ncbi:MAG: N-formylglutamate amidohydrolase [Alphaproteobacteria bacterium]|nr:N-formylglutamate amidohydrolase [Alphaproteobacteria bacterium]